MKTLTVLAVTLATLAGVLVGPADSISPDEWIGQGLGWAAAIAIAALAPAAMLTGAPRR